MKKFSRVIRSPQMSAVLAVVKIAALCFSVGEGLYLSPFPVPTFSSELYARLAVSNAPNATSRQQYGPLDVPVQSQKRSKRQVLNLAGPAAAGTPDVVLESLAALDLEPTSVASVLSLPRPAGRAPPFRF